MKEDVFDALAIASLIAIGAMVVTFVFGIWLILEVSGGPISERTQIGLLLGGFTIGYILGVILQWDVLKHVKE